MMYMVQNNELKPLDMGQKHHCEALDRMVEEWGGYMEYKAKAESSGDTRYKSASADEFRHALVALFDLIVTVKKHAMADPERAEFASFWTELQSAMAK